jgi:hypothetical protein
MTTTTDQFRQRAREDRFENWFISLRLRAAKQYNLKLEDMTKAERDEYLYGQTSKTGK